MIKFDKPIQTKSGMDITDVWNELQECWSVYKKAKLDHDLQITRECALKIRQLQNDIGLKKAKFPELTESPTVNQN